MASDEDVNMSDEVEMAPDHHIIVKQYIVVDTNILIHRLDAVKSLFQVLSLPVLQSAFHLLVPSIVIHELDNIQKSDRAEIRDQAREAMRFLLRLIQLRRSDELVPLRVQRQSEVLRTDLNKPDDRVLDCCLFFKPVCQQIWLWTRDLNLNVAAESNDVHMLPSRTVGEIVDSLGVGRVTEVRKELQTWSLRQRDGGAVEEEEGGMEFDTDLDQELPSLSLDVSTDHPHAGIVSTQASGTLLDDYLSRYPPLPSGDITPLSPSSASSSRPNLSSTLSSPSSNTLYDQYDHLILALQPIILHLHLTSPTSDRILTALHEMLRSTEKAVETGIAARQPPTDEQRILLEGISATRILARYFERSLFDRERTPRLGQVVEAIEDMALMCQALGLGDAARRSLVIVANQLKPD